MFELVFNDDSLFYYKIGGGWDIVIFFSLNIMMIDLFLNVFVIVLICSGFDLMVVIENLLDNIRNGVDNVVNVLELVVLAVIVNLLGYIL